MRSVFITGAAMEAIFRKGTTSRLAASLLWLEADSGGPGVPFAVGQETEEGRIWLWI